MSKLPEKFKPVIIQQVQPNEASVEIVEMLTGEQDKINAIIEYLEQYEQQKPCEHTEKRWVSMIDAFICQDCKRII